MSMCDMCQDKIDDAYREGFGDAREEVETLRQQLAKMTESYERCFEAFCRKDERVKELESRLVAPSVVNHEAMISQITELQKKCRAAESVILENQSMHQVSCDLELMGELRGKCDCIVRDAAEYLKSYPVDLTSAQDAR